MFKNRIVKRNIWKSRDNRTLIKNIKWESYAEVTEVNMYSKDKKTIKKNEQAKEIPVTWLAVPFWIIKWDGLLFYSQCSNLDLVHYDICGFTVIKALL